MRKIYVVWSGIAWAVLLGHNAWADDDAMFAARNRDDVIVIRPVASTSSSSSSPSVWNKVSQGTKNMVTGTKNLFTSNKSTPKKTTPWAPKPKQKTWYQKLFGAEDPPKKKPQSPSEWIMQPRVAQ
jgi:hypothetical protein